MFIPQAGLGAWCYHGKKWQLGLDTEDVVDVRIILIEMKGRNSRFKETPLESIDDVVDDLVRELRLIFSSDADADYAIFRFSLGVWIA